MKPASLFCFFALTCASSKRNTSSLRDVGERPREGTADPGHAFVRIRENAWELVHGGRLGFLPLGFLHPRAVERPSLGDARTFVRAGHQPSPSRLCSCSRRTSSRAKC